MHQQVQPEPPAFPEGHAVYPGIALCLDDKRLSAALAQRLWAYIANLPLVITDRTALVHLTEKSARAMVTDWAGEDWTAAGSMERIWFVGDESVSGEKETVRRFRKSDTVIEELAPAIIQYVTSDLEKRLFAREMEGNARARLLEHIRLELSTFYHNINNPLTILSGNIQLLQLVAESMHVSADLMKPIEDIGSISARFADDLKQITALREKITPSKLHS